MECEKQLFNTYFCDSKAHQRHFENIPEWAQPTQANSTYQNTNIKKYLKTRIWKDLNIEHSLNVGEGTPLAELNATEIFLEWAT